MVMIKQYPHTITVQIPGNSSQDGNGNWNTVPGTTITLKGRAEMKAGNRMGNAYIEGADGVMVQIQCIIFLPLPIDTIPVGSEVEVKDGNETLVKANALQFSKGQLNARLWL